MSPSTTVTTARDAASVGTVEPTICVRAIRTFASSPPRAGMKAFIATPAAYAPATETTRTCRPGYAATRTPRQAKDRNASVPSWRTRAATRNRPSRRPKPIGCGLEDVDDRAGDVHPRPSVP